MGKRAEQGGGGACHRKMVTAAWLGRHRFGSIGGVKAEVMVAIIGGVRHWLAGKQLGSGDIAAKCGYVASGDRGHGSGRGLSQKIGRSVKKLFGLMVGGVHPVAGRKMIENTRNHYQVRASCRQ